MKKSLFLLALLALVLPLSAFAQSPAPTPAVTLAIQPAAAAVPPAAVPPIDWTTIAGTSPQTLPGATPTPQFVQSGWCSISCTPCPCARNQGLCRPFACIVGVGN